MGSIPPPKTCGLYLPGHEVHWIQGIHSSDRGEAPPVACRILEVRRDGTALVAADSVTVELWTHEPQRLEAFVAELGPSAFYQERWRLLRFPHVTETTGRLAHDLIHVALASDPERRACPDEPPRHATLMQQLREAGGFTIRGAGSRRAAGPTG